VEKRNANVKDRSQTQHGKRNHELAFVATCLTNREWKAKRQGRTHQKTRKRAGKSYAAAEDKRKRGPGGLDQTDLHMGN